MAMSPFLAFVIVVLGVGFVAGIFIFLIRRAPFIPGEFKQVAEWIILAVAIIYLLVRGLGLIGVAL